MKDTAGHVLEEEDRDHDYQLSGSKLQEDRKAVISKSFLSSGERKKDQDSINFLEIFVMVHSCQNHCQETKREILRLAPLVRIFLEEQVTAVRISMPKIGSLDSLS